MLKTSLLLALSAGLLTSPLHAADAPTITNVTPEQAAKLIAENPKLVVLDVRTPEEFQAGHIPGAKNVDLFSTDFAQKVAALDPKAPVLVHCASGGRSTQSLKSLKDKATVYHLDSGFKGWEKAGQPVEK